MQSDYRLRRFAPWTWVLALATWWAAQASIAQVAIPPELRGWEGWVLRGHETHGCPWLVPGKATDETRVCAWPSVLELQVDDHGGRFSQRWLAAAETWLPVPGNTDNWPESLSIDGSPAAAVLHDGTPALRAASGTHTITGSFRWTRRPELLPLPASVALVALSIDGARSLTPQRSDAGVILGAHAIARQDDHVDVRVFRRLDDDLPALLTTQIHLAVAGEAREIRLPAVLPEGFVPTALESTLAARLDPDNALRVQVRPGEFQLTLEARGPSPVAEVRLGPRVAPWPADEVWSFQAEDRLRVAAIEGAAAIDPAQANVPQDWHELPAYRLNPGAALRVVERSRGLSALDGNELQLRRTAWLDFAGAGYTIVDTLSGGMRQGWRLDMGAPYALTSARSGSAESLLITAGMTSGLTGVELREPHVDLTAVSRLDRARGSFPATGWRTRFTNVSGQLVMAPGYRLLAAFGPDSAPQAWLERWRLLDIFAVLLIATVAWRIFGLRTGLIALGAIALTYQESGAPTWLWLAVLIALALQRAAPEGRLRAWAAAGRLLAFVLLVFALVPFAITQARLAIYPQLEALEAVPYPANIATAAPTAAALAGRPVREYKRELEAPPPIQTDIVREQAKSAAVSSPAASASVPIAATSVPIEEVVTTASRATGSGHYEPGAVVQAGPGLPAWHYHAYPYSWSGPVEENATARFLVSPPWMTRLWRVLGLLLSGLLLFDLTRRELPALANWLRRPWAGMAAVLISAALGFGANREAHASTTPDPARLDELRTLLLAPPRCAPDCAEVLAAEVSVDTARLGIVLSVSALDAVAVALPGAEPNWTPDVVQVDGVGAGWVRRGPRGIRYVSLTPGRHSVRVEGSLGALDALSLAFPMRPRVIDVRAPDWYAGGVSDRHLVSGALELVRRRNVTAATNSAARQEAFPPFVDVDRLFHLSHDWTIDTTVTRIAPKSAAFTVSLPLLPQEAVTTAGLRASEGRIALGLAAGETAQAFASILPRADTLELTAPRDPSHIEHWRFEVGPTWHVEFSGVPAVTPQEDGATWSFEFYPRPGEHLRLNATRPAATAGGTVAFDNVRLRTVVGKRSSDTTLALDYRSTQGGRQILHIPADAVVTRVQSDGEALALRPEHGELSLSALPGTHTWSVDWETANGARLIARSPPVNLNAPASNLQLSVRVPEDRWVLYAFGPGVGPTILYWGELLLFIVAAWLLGRSALTPLPARDWLLLGLGLSTFSWLVLGLFAVFMALFQWRARHGAPVDSQRFKLLQVGCALLAVIAILAVVAAVPQGLLAYPDMRIAPEGNSGELSWFVDQTSGRLPAPGVLSVSLWWYKVAMLAWALWLSFALTRWVRWAWQVFTRDGLWRGDPATPPPPSQQPRDGSEPAV